MISIALIFLSLLTLSTPIDKFSMEESYLRQFAFVHFHPYIATIRPRQESRAEADCLVTGTIISPKWILTNALGVINNGIDVMPSKFSLVAGSAICPGTEFGTQRVPISNATIHPDFDYENDDKFRHNDIALVLLQDELNFTSKISNVFLSSGESFESICAAISLGRKKGLRIVTQVSYDEKHCQEIREASSKEFCTVGYRSKECYGITSDLGTPLMCDYVQVGLLTFDGQCEAHGPLVWINIVNYLEWISNTTKADTVRGKKMYRLPTITGGGCGRKFASLFILFIVLCKEIYYITGT